MFSLATIIAYDLICRAFSIIIFFLCSISRFSFAFCLFPLCEFAFALRVLAYFLLYFHVFPVPCWWTFSVPTQLNILSGMLYLFKSIKTDLAQVFWIFLYEYLNLSSLIVIYYNTWNIFCLVCVWISPAMQSGVSDVCWEPTLAVTLQHCFCRASSTILHSLLNLLLLLFDYVILLKDVIAFVYDRVHKLLVCVLF